MQNVGSFTAKNAAAVSPLLSGRKLPVGHVQPHGSTTVSGYIVFGCDRRLVAIDGTRPGDQEGSIEHDRGPRPTLSRCRQFARQLRCGDLRGLMFIDFYRHVELSLTTPPSKKLMKDKAKTTVLVSSWPYLGFWADGEMFAPAFCVRHDRGGRPQPLPRLATAYWSLIRCYWTTTSR